MSDTAKAIWLTVIGVVLVFALAIGVWAFKVATSDVRGKGNAFAQKNSAKNWTEAQARFESLYAEIVATDRKVTVAAHYLAKHPGDRTAEDTYLGTQNVCLSFVADYNAAARTYLAADFRSVDLPAQIDDNDHATDCKE
jgi:hypothetical protein